MVPTLAKPQVIARVQPIHNMVSDILTLKYDETVYLCPFVWYKLISPVILHPVN